MFIKKTARFFFGMHIACPLSRSVSNRHQNSYPCKKMTRIGQNLPEFDFLFSQYLHP